MHRHKTGLLGGGNHLPVPQSFVMLASWMEQGLTFIPTGFPAQAHHGEDGAYAVESGVWKIESTGNVHGCSAQGHGVREPNVRGHVIQRLSGPAHGVRERSVRDRKENGRARLGKRGVQGSGAPEMSVHDRSGTGRHVPDRGMTAGCASRTGARMCGVRVRDHGAPKTGALGRSALRYDNHNRNPSGCDARGCRTNRRGGPGHSVRTSGDRGPSVRGHRNVPVPVTETVSTGDVPPSGLPEMMPVGVVAPLGAHRIPDGRMRLAVRRMPDEGRAPDMGRRPIASRLPCRIYPIRISLPFLLSSCSCSR